MKFCTYKISHPSGYFYIGKGSTEAFKQEKYWGSGRRIKDAYKKYPHTEWSREILGMFEEENAAYQHEESLVTEDLLLNPLCLNLSLGGRGNNSRKHTIEERLAKSERQKGKSLGPKPESVKLKISASKLGVKISSPRKVECPHCGKSGGANTMHHWHFDNCKSKDGNHGSNPVNRSSQKGRVFSLEHKAKLSLAAKKRYGKQTTL